MTKTKAKPPARGQRLMDELDGTTMPEAKRGAMMTTRGKRRKRGTPAKTPMRLRAGM